MFNRRLLTAMGVATVATIAVAIWLNRPAATQDQNELTAFIPALKSQRDSVNQISIQTTQQTFTLRLNEQRWQVVERDGYAANNSKVRELITALSESKIAETKTADPARYSKLGVEDGGDKSVTVTLKAGEQTLAHFIAGNSVYRPAGHYVRLVGEAPSYLIDRELKLGRELRDWIDSEIVNVPATKISKIERLNASAQSAVFTLSKASGSAEFTLDNLAANKEMQAAHIVSGLSDVMNGLTANDVIKADKVPSEGAKQTVTRFYSDDKQIITISYTAVADKHYVSFVITSADDASAEVKTASEKLHNKLQGWAFEINSYKGEGLARGSDELTQKKEAKK